jgi:hypothetical protein
MSETPGKLNAAERHARREGRLSRAGTLVGRAISLAMLIGGLAISATILARDGSWTSVALASLFLGMALRGLLSLLDVERRSVRLTVPLVCCTAVVFAVSSVASVSALLADSLVPAVFLAPASFAMAAFHVALARSLRRARHAA